MRIHKFWLVISVTSLAASASPQFSAARPLRPKPPIHIATGSGGGWRMGVDNCVGAHTLVPAGPQVGVPFTTGTTGTQGQNEGVCYFFGTSGISFDVWFDWQATLTGTASMRACGGTTVDTRLVAYPLNASSCPADGTGLACNDDACGLQSIISWSVVAGTSYTLQLGVFPGGSGGSGTFDLTEQVALPCGEYDDRQSENALGLTAGGEMGWLHYSQCIGGIGGIDTAYGVSGGGGSLNGNASRIALWEDVDCDADPTTGLILMETLSTIVTNADTDILNYNPFANQELPTSGCAWSAATAVHAAGQFPAPMDQTNPTPNAWVAGMTSGAGGVMDLDNLNANNVPPLQMQAIGFPAAFLSKPGYCTAACLKCAQSPTDTRNCGICFSPPCNGGGSGTSTCFGTAGCPCGNNGNSGEGCANSTGSGAILTGTGLPSLSNDTLELVTTQIPNTPGLTFQGNVALGSPPLFGDGLRCCGVSVVRLITVLAQGNCASTNQPTGCGTQIGGIGGPISQHPGNASLQAGDSRCYQHWYRDPAGSPCGTGFNLSNGYVVTWML